MSADLTGRLHQFVCLLIKLGQADAFLVRIMVAKSKLACEVDASNKDIRSSRTRVSHGTHERELAVDSPKARFPRHLARISGIHGQEPAKAVAHLTDRSDMTSTIWLRSMPIQVPVPFFRGDRDELYPLLHRSLVHLRLDLRDPLGMQSADNRTARIDEIQNQDFRGIQQPDVVVVGDAQRDVPSRFVGRLEISFFLADHQLCFFEKIGHRSRHVCRQHRQGYDISRPGSHHSTAWKLRGPGPAVLLDRRTRSLLNRYCPA